MSDLETLAFIHDDGRLPNGAKGRLCRHLKWQRTYVTRREWSCQCGHAPDSVKVRAGGNARSRGLAIQREIAHSLGLVNLQGNGPTDARSESEVFGNAAFVCQVKSGARFPGWMATELAKLPTTGGRIPILAIAETPGPGRKRRAVIVVEIRDWIDLHGGAK